MLSKIQSLIDSIELNLTQWAVITLSAAIGGLVLALKLQGSKLHRTQVQLLETQVNAQEASDDEVVSTARAAFQKAFNDYKNAGGRSL